MKPAPFAYLRPDSVAEALAALAQHGSDARILAGGQSLGAILNMRLVNPAVVIDINGLDEISTCAVTPQTFVTGALVRQADALIDGRIRDGIPLLAHALPHVGHYQTRNRGTLGGSVAHADPSAEIPLALATLDGEVELRSARGRRRVKATNFFQSALVTTRQPDELVTALHWPARRPRQGFAFTEFAVRSGDYAIVAVACIADTADNGLSNVRFGFGGCGDRPQIVAIDVGASRRLDDASVAKIALDAAAQIECRTDLMASADYRRQLARVLAGDALQSAAKVAQVHA